MRGRIQPECVAGFSQNGWPDLIGIGGRFAPQYASLEKRKFAIFAARGDEEEGPHSSEIRMSLGHDAMSTANQQPEPVLPPFIVTVIAWKTKASAEVGHSMASLPVRVGVSHASVWSRAWITSWIAMDGSRSMNGALGGVSVTCPSCRVFGSVAASAFVTME